MRRGGLPACAACCMLEKQKSDRAHVPHLRQTRNEVIDQSADASRLAVGRKLDTKPYGNIGEKVSAAEKVVIF